MIASKTLKNGQVNKSALLADLPPPWPKDLRPAIRAASSARAGHTVIVLDDDPTGTQTVHDVPVPTAWDEAALRTEFAQPDPCFYILTNSGSLPPNAAAALNRTIARNLEKAAIRHPTKDAPCPGCIAPAAGSDTLGFTLVSRSDSTLRGHFPVETDALEAEMGAFDATILIPYFEAGGRLTIDDVHCIADGETLIPVANTTFARDAAFGYQTLDLRERIEEKTGGRIQAESVHYISLRELRTGALTEEPTRAVTERLLGLPQGSVCIVNAAHPRDVDFFALAALQAELTGRRFLYRTAASFVASRLGMEAADYRLLSAPSKASGVKNSASTAPGGLIVIGSYVDKTTEQLQRLQQQATLVNIELDVPSLLEAGQRVATVCTALTQTATALVARLDVVVFTSRGVVLGPDAFGSLEIGRQISDALVSLVQQLRVRPRFFIAKGRYYCQRRCDAGTGRASGMGTGPIAAGCARLASGF